MVASAIRELETCVQHVSISRIRLAIAAIFRVEALCTTPQHGKYAALASASPSPSVAALHATQLHGCSVNTRRLIYIGYPHFNAGNPLTMCTVRTLNSMMLKTRSKI